MLTVAQEELDKRLSAQEAAAQSARQAFRQAALDAVREVLKREDGTLLTLSQAGLSAVHTDMTAQLVIVSDGTVHLGANRADGGAWRVRLVAQEDGVWRRRSDPVSSLADIAAAWAAL